MLKAFGEEMKPVFETLFYINQEKLIEQHRLMNEKQNEYNRKQAEYVCKKLTGIIDK